MLGFNNRLQKCTWNMGKASEVQGVRVPHADAAIFLTGPQASLIGVLAHIFWCIFLSLDSNVLEELSFFLVCAPPDLIPLCSFSCIKQHSTSFPSLSIFLPYVVCLPYLIAPTWPSFDSGLLFPSLCLLLCFAQHHPYLYQKDWLLGLHQPASEMNTIMFSLMLLFPL